MHAGAPKWLAALIAAGKWVYSEVKAAAEDAEKFVKEAAAKAGHLVLEIGDALKVASNKAGKDVKKFLNKNKVVNAVKNGGKHAVKDVKKSFKKIKKAFRL